MINLEPAAADVLAAAVALKNREPTLTCVVLECTNIPPYRAAIEAATGMKTWALVDDERLIRPWCQACSYPHQTRLYLAARRLL